MTPCHVDNISCICPRNDITPIHNITDRGGQYGLNTQTGVDVLPTPPIYTLWTPLPRIPPPPKPYFGVKKGG